MITLHSKDGEETVLKGIHIPGVLEDPEAPYKYYFDVLNTAQSVKDELFIQLRNRIMDESTEKNGIYICNIRDFNLKDSKGNIVYELRYYPKRNNYIGAFLRTDLDGRVETDCINHYNVGQLLALLLILVRPYTKHGTKRDMDAYKRDIVIEVIANVIKRYGCLLYDSGDYVLGVKALKLPSSCNHKQNCNVSMLYWRSSDNQTYEVFRNENCTSYYNLTKWDYRDVFLLAQDLIDTFEND